MMTRRVEWEKYRRGKASSPRSQSAGQKTGSRGIGADRITLCHGCWSTRLELKLTLRNPMWTNKVKHARIIRQPINMGFCHKTLGSRERAGQNTRHAWTFHDPYLVCDGCGYVANKSQRYERVGEDRCPQATRFSEASSSSSATFGSNSKVSHERHILRSALLD